MRCTYLTASPPSAQRLRALGQVGELYGVCKLTSLPRAGAGFLCCYACSSHSVLSAGIHCAGRIVINLWRTLRSELKLNIYTFESCVAALLQLRTPHIPPWTLHGWWLAPGASSQLAPSLVPTLLGAFRKL